MTIASGPRTEVWPIQSPKSRPRRSSGTRRRTTSQGDARRDREDRSLERTHGRRPGPSPGKRKDRNAALNADRRGGVRDGSCHWFVRIARTLYSVVARSPFGRPALRRDSAGRQPTAVTIRQVHADRTARAPRTMFRPVSSKPDLVAQEHEVLNLWRERRTFARLRAQNAGNERWSFLDGPITANNPMGVHHAWGRAYKDLFQRFWAMHGRDQRYQNGFDCQGLWVEVNVERDLGFTSKRDIEAYGIAEFVSLCKQRVLTYAARQTEQSIRLGMWMDWNDPHELRRLRDALAEDPAQARDDHEHRRHRGHRHRRDAGRAARPAGAGRQLLHVLQREQLPDLVLPGRVPPPRLALQGPRHDALVRPLRHRHQPARDDRGLRRSRRSGPDRQVPAARPARRGAAGLDHDALDADLERGRGGGRGPALRQGPARATRSFWLGRGTLKQALEGPVPDPGGEARPRARGLALRRPVRRAAGGPGRLRRRAREPPRSAAV